MVAPTASDQILLRTILDLTELRSGQPPTLAEVAVALGYQSTSRGNVQRQLARLKPEYVTWTKSPRSLQLTPNGRALLQSTPPAAQSPGRDIPVDEPILPLLASGLTRMAHEVEEGRPLQAPYPITWQRGLNLLAIACLMRGTSPPLDTADAIDWCQRPPSAWPISFASHLAPVPDRALLEGDEPTAFCRELAQSVAAGDVEHEISEKAMLHIKDLAARLRQPHSYVALRRYVIEHPVVQDDDLLDATFTDPALHSPFASELQDLYEPVPIALHTDGRLQICPRCGWTLTRRPGGLQCGDDRCRLESRNFTTPEPKDYPVLPGERMLRVRRAIRRYVVVPGLLEVSLWRQLSALRSPQESLVIDLWPGYDAYDLRITFPDGSRWAVDVKDWRYAHLLVPHLRPLRAVEGEALDRTFYVIPDERVREQPAYLTTLRAATATHPFEVVTASELIELATERIEATYA